jgi:spermidine/putrescine transport system ATP-binding protein
MSMSDRIAVMNDGRIAQVGPPEEIYREPASQFVAEFIGDTNLLDAEIRERDSSAVAAVGGADGFEVAADGHTGSVTVSIRPEDFELVPASAGGTVTGEVVERYFQGDQTIYVFEPDGQLGQLQVVVQGRETTVDTGDRAAVRVIEGAPVVF